MESFKKYMAMMLLFVACGGIAAGSERPAITRQEAEVLKEVAELAGTDPATAMATLQAAREHPRASAALDYSAGNLLMGLEEFVAAQSAYEMALEKHPDFPEATLGLARSLVWQEKWVEAASILRSLSQSADAPVAVMLLHGYVLLAQERYVSAETIYRQAALQDGDTKDAVMGLARAFLGQQRYREASAILREWVLRNPLETNAWQLLAEIEWTAGQAESALITLETARRMAPLSTSMIRMLGDLYQSRGMMAEAVRLYESMDTVLTDEALIGFRWVDALLALGRIEAAGRRLDAMSDAADDPHYQEVRVRWAEAADMPDQMQDALRRWIELDPVNERALLRMGDAKAEEGDLEAATLWYDRARLAHSQNAAPLMRLARTALDRERFDEAAQWLEQAHIVTGDPHIERSLQQVRRLAEMQ